MYAHSAPAVTRQHTTSQSPAVKRGVRLPATLAGRRSVAEPCERCEMSWTENLHVPGEPGGKHPGSPVHIYTRKAPAQSVAEMRALLDSELDSAVDTDGLGPGLS